jgi:hypothetical protein
MSDKSTMEKARQGAATDAEIAAAIAAERRRCIDRVLTYAALRDQAAVDLDKAASGSGPEKPAPRSQAKERRSARDCKRKWRAT